MTIANAVSSTHNNPKPQVDILATNVSTSYRADQNVISDKISYSYDCKISYPTDSVVFQGSKFRIAIYLSTDYFESPSTLINGSSSSVIRGITITFSLRNIDQNYSSLKALLNLNHKTFP